MIERRYPIQTVLAERKMFAGGGAVLPQQMMPQQPMMPQQQQSGGILASSGPLLDAVAAGAINPDGDGGGSLSDVQGFSNGGLNRFTTDNDGNYVPVVPEQIAQPQAVDVGVPVNLRSERDFAPRQGERVLLGAGATRDDMRARMLAMANMGPAGKEDLVLPYEAQVQAGFMGEQLDRPGFAGMGLEPGARAPIDDAGRTLYNFLDQSARGLSKVSTGAVNIILDIGDMLISDKPEDTGGNFYGQISAVNEALRRHPRVDGVLDEDIQSEISRVSKEVLSEAPDISGDSLGAILAEHLVTKYEAPYREATELQDNAGDEFNAGDYNFIYDRSGLESGDGLNEEGLIDESFPSENPVATTTADPTVDQDEAEGEFVGGSPAVEGGPTVSSSVFGFETPKDDVYRGTTNKMKIALENVINDNSPDKTKSAMATAVEEFNAAMPEYEGMSESEKGFAIMEAGLRIMAGKSPDALTNIAEGLKGLGPKFAKDAKEKRAWNRQVDLSAAKYGLEKIAKDSTRAEALAKEGRGLKTVFWMSDVFGPDGGLRGKKGTSGFITNEEIQSGLYDGKFEAGLALATERLKNETTKNTSLLRKMIGQTRKGGPSDEYFDKTLKAYSKSSLKLSDYATQLALVDVSADINKEGNATGFGAYAARKINSFYNAFNLNRPKGSEEKRIESMDDITSSDIDKLDVDASRKRRLKSIKSNYSLLDKMDRLAADGRESAKFVAQQQELANLLIKEILGEGSKNVSNIDRELASEIVGLYRGTATITADPTIIAGRLDRIRARILKNYETEANNMDASERFFTGIIDRNYQDVTSTYFKPVRRSALGQIQSSLDLAGMDSPPAIPKGLNVRSPYNFSTVNGKRTYRFR